VNKIEILAKVICDVQKNFISKSFYDDDGNRSNKDVSSIKIIEEMNNSYDDITRETLEFRSLKDMKFNNVKPEDKINNIERWYGDLMLFKYDDIEVKVYLMETAEQYSYTGPFILIYKIKENL
jgi:hypothetical protein